VSVHQRVTSTLPVCVLLAAVVLLHGSSFAADPNPADARSDSACESAEDCYRAALVQKGSPDKTVTHEDRLRAKIDRLRLVMEQHPGSLWAKRAGLVTGVILAEREPVDADPVEALVSRLSRPSQTDDVHLVTGGSGRPGLAGDSWLSDGEGPVHHHADRSGHRASTCS